jgi:multidrug efflux system membrane fusion protein
VDGRIGLRLVDPGNYIQTSDTAGIAVVNTINPITVVFSIPEINLGDVLHSTYNPLIVAAYDRDQKILLDTGKLLAFDNQIDTSTGMIKLKAQFDNEKYNLFPNQFVNIQLLVKTLQNAVVIPTAAVQYGPSTSYVYVLNKDNHTVSQRTVVTGVTEGDNTVVTTGISLNESVVVEGGDKLVDGASVKVAPKSGVIAQLDSSSKKPQLASTKKSQKIAGKHPQRQGA